MKPTVSIALSLPLFALLSGAALAQSALVSLPGAASGDRFGAAMSAFRDVNGDGFVDVLVGAPGAEFGNGVVWVVSGRYLADATGAALLHQVGPWTTAGSGYLFGSSLAVIGDLTGDGVPEFAVGAPGIDYFPVGNDSGFVYVFNGATLNQHSVFYGNTASQRFGASMATVGDVNGDGKAELAVGAPGVYNTLSGGVMVLGGAGMSVQSTQLVWAYSIAVGANSGEDGFGTSLASGFDLDGDGLNDIVVGSPYLDNPGAGEGGGVWIMRPLFGPGGSPSPIYASYRSTLAGEHLGRSVSARDDYNGDGVVDIVVGAPDRIAGVSAQEGRAFVLSGQKVATNATPKELHTLYPTSGNPNPISMHFGAAVCASPDLNGDGVGDFIVGAPDYSVTFPSGPGRGAATIYSGRTGLRMGGLVGANNERMGDGFVGGFDDLSGDGFPEFIVAGSFGDTPSTDIGRIKSYRLFTAFPSTYCTAKVNSLGCSPSIGYSGSPSASSPSQFLVTCTNLLNQKTGLLTYSANPLATPFQGGVLCIASPFARTPMQQSGGSTTGSDCSGALSYDFNFRIQSGLDPMLVAGAEVFLQYRSRDPLAVASTSLSNGLRLVINP